MGPQPVLARQRWVARPGGAAARERRPADRSRAGDGDGAWACCARCGAPIARTDARTPIDGAVEYTRVNPAGYLHSFACFADAPGCALVGPPTDEASWFSGHSWQLADCAACHLHLGWRFAADERVFFGLLIERLVERPAPHA